MAKQGIHKINSLRLKWIGCQLLADALWAFACASIFLNAWFLLNHVVHIYLPSNWHIWLWSVLSYAVILAIHRPWRVGQSLVAAFLNGAYPQLEESAELIIENPDELGLLQK